MPSDSVIHALAGAAGGIVAMSATYPLIFISTRAAVETKNEQKSTYQTVLEILKREGVLGLYSGLSSSLLGVAVTNGVYYYFYEHSRGAILDSRLHTGRKGLSTLESMIAGFIAGTATTIISNPVWVIQTSQAVRTMNSSSSPSPSSSSSSVSSSSPDPSRPPKRLGFLETIDFIIRKDGIGAFWRGLGPALVLVANPMLQYTVFEQLKNYLVRHRLAKLRAKAVAGKTGTGVAVIVGAAAVLTDLDYFLLGALSKLVATSITYPYIVVKSRLYAGQAQALKYKSALHGLISISKEEGIQGLYKGVGSKLTQSVLTAAILFAGQRRIYEITKKAVSR